MSRRDKNQLLYIDYFLRKHPDLLHLYPNSKEITESVGSAMALWYKVDKVDRSDENTQVYVLGDGKTPMTGALISQDSRFNVVSIDPRLVKKEYPDIPRLKIFQGKSQDYKDINMKASLSVIVGVHSHAPLKEFWDRVPDPKIAIVIPCCSPQETDREPDLEYDDTRIFSKKNHIKIWDNRN